MVEAFNPALPEEARNNAFDAEAQMNSTLIWASEVRFLFKVRATGSDSSGPGVRVEPTASATAGRKPEAGPPDPRYSGEAAVTLTLKAVRVRDCKGRGQNHLPLRRVSAAMSAAFSGSRHSDARMPLPRTHD